MNYENAVTAYMAAYGEGVLTPSANLSTQSKTGRWVLRNVTGFLAYVTSTGVVLDRKFQRVAE